MHERKQHSKFELFDKNGQFKYFGLKKGGYLLNNSEKIKEKL